MKERLILIIVLVICISSCAKTVKYDLENDNQYASLKCIETKVSTVIIRDIYTCGLFGSRKEDPWGIAIIDDQYKNQLLKEKVIYKSIINSKESYCGDRQYYKDIIEVPIGSKIYLSSLSTYETFSIGVPQAKYTGKLSINNIPYTVAYEELQTRKTNNDKKFKVTSIDDHLLQYYNKCSNNTFKMDAKQHAPFN